MKDEPLPIFVHFISTNQKKKKKKKWLLLDDPCKIKYPLGQIYYYTHADQDYKNRLNLTHQNTIFQGQYVTNIIVQ